MTIIPEPWRSLAAEWVPRLLAAWSADGLETPAGTIRLLGLPDGLSLVSGEVCVTSGPVAFRTSHPLAVAYARGEPVEIGGQRVSFADPVPRAEGIPDGLRITWATPGIVHGFFARVVGVKVRGVRLYARSCVVELDGVEDRSFTW